MGILNQGILDRFDFEWQWILPPSFNSLFHRPVTKLGLESFLAIKCSLDAYVLLCLNDQAMAAAPVPYSADFIL